MPRGKWKPGTKRVRSIAVDEFFEVAEAKGFKTKKASDFEKISKALGGLVKVDRMYKWSRGIHRPITLDEIKAATDLLRELPDKSRRRRPGPVSKNEKAGPVPKAESKPVNGHASPTITAVTALLETMPVSDLGEVVKLATAKLASKLEVTDA